ncbi:uncharacterized protein LY89DRAFT_736982 [Mollisia scopiformis]|uniref:Uncharacterized protein n=1 Tax=Mollisia scopiformis TaxID=149040 RepID=A0A194X1A9_MOLSC|nr:uncharacterized protein LY89DRAFT_736982 [Mollisia scopiformis]KUJ13980.1 hypothetical protein LY89DRAFT_736982 [Mollisia scopiformis]
MDATTPTYESGILAWLTEWDSRTPPLFLIDGRQLEKQAYDHPVQIVKRMKSVTRDITYLVLLLTSFGSMPPDVYLIERAVRRDGRVSVPIFNPASPWNWPASDMNGIKVPALKLTPRSTLGSRKQSYLRLEMLFTIPERQLRRYNTAVSLNKQPRLTKQSFSHVMEALAWLEVSGTKPVRAPRIQPDRPDSASKSREIPEGSKKPAAAKLPLEIISDESELAMRPIQGHGGQSVTKSYEAPREFQVAARPSLLVRCTNMSQFSSRDPRAVFHFELLSANIDLDARAGTRAGLSSNSQEAMIAMIQNTTWNWFILGSPDPNAILVVPTEGSLELMTDQQSEDIRNKIAKGVSLQSVVAQANEAVLMAGMEPMFVAGRMSWFLRTGAVAIYICQSVAAQLIGQRHRESITTCPSMVMVIVGGVVPFLILLEH